MGYYTNFEIATDRHDRAVMARLSEIAGEAFDDDGLNDAKWYEHESHLKAVSAEFPTVLITVTGSGEERGDYWRKYFRNGAMQKAELTFSPCTLARPTVKTKTVNVTVLGHDVPIEIEYIGNPSEDELYLQAKQQLKKLI